MSKVRGPWSISRAFSGAVWPDASGDAEVVRSRSRGVVDRVVDAVDRPRLGRVWRSGQREIGVTAGFEEHGNLVVDAAPFAVGPGVVEGPVAVDEAEGDGAVTAAAKQPVSVEQRLGEAAQAIAQRIGRIPVVMKMDFDIAEPAPTEICQRVEQLGPISFLREEERVLWRAAVGVGEPFRKSRIPLDPCGDACALYSGVGGSVVGLEMVGDAEKYVSRPVNAPGRQRPA